MFLSGVLGITMQKLRNNRGKLPILIIIIVVIVAALGGTGFLLLKGKAKGANAEAKKPEKKAEALMALQEFVVNLADLTEPHYLKLEINLSVTGEVPEGGGGEGEGAGASDPFLPIIRDTIITVVSRHTYNELLTNGGKDVLRTEIHTALDKAVPHLEVEKVYFVNFAMQ